jgi:thiol-disulfide isomerase/thioredoxin
VYVMKVASTGEEFEMPEIAARLGVLILVSLLLWLLIWSGRHLVEIQRRRALAAPPLRGLADFGDRGIRSSTSPVRILAFSSIDCKQCHQLQQPALRRVEEMHGGNVSVVEVDATTSPELVRKYHVLTVPTTVVLDASGFAHAINYGFANTRRLLEQVDAVMEQASSAAS